jgi:hypothetical protein
MATSLLAIFVLAAVVLTAQAAGIEPSKVKPRKFYVDPKNFVNIIPSAFQVLLFRIFSNM